MSETAVNRVLALVAFACALSVAALLGVGLQAGISQETFQAARLASENLARLVTNPQGLRLNIAFDNAFVVLYTVFFTLLAHRLRGLVAREVLMVALFALLLGALLDATENHHILIMLFSAEHEIPISTAETQLQMIASSVKFHLVYVSAFLFAFGYFRLGAWGKIIAAGTWFVFVPLGLVIYMTPLEAVRPLVIARGVFFIVTFLLSAIMFVGLKPAKEPVLRST